MRFDLLPVSRHMWRRRGTRRYIPTPGNNVKVGVCGAVRYPNGPFVFTHRPQKTMITEQLVKLLGELAHRVRRTGRRIILVLDNGTSFTSSRSTQELQAVKEWIQVFWLPTYTSEQLSLIEPIWGRTKDEYFSRMLTKKKEDFIPAVVSFLTRLRRPGALRKLFRPSALPKYCDNFSEAA